MNEKCLHIYVDKGGERVECLNCSRTWSPDPEPEWPRRVTIKNSEYVGDVVPGLSAYAKATMSTQFWNTYVTYSVNQDGTFEILSVNGRKLEDE